MIFVLPINNLLSIAYVLVVNLITLSQSGMDHGAVFTATAFTAIIGTLLIGLLANFPIAIAPSMGLNSFFATIVGMMFGLIEVPSSIVGSIPSLEPTFGVVFSHLDEMFTPEILTVIFTFLIVAFFDTAGALIGLTSQAGMMKDNKIPNIGKGLLADSAAGVIGAILGTSTPATSVESSAGIAVGGKNGFTSVVIAACFAVALFFSPLVNVISVEVTSAALIIVGH